MSHIFILTLVTFFLVFCPNLYALDLERLQKTTDYLASDALMGRKAGTETADKAAQFIADEFKEIGLRPYDRNGYLQRFPLSDSASFDANVIGYIAAANDTDKSIVITAHYDGLGVDPSLHGEDKIFNGARDNAVGVAALIALANKLSQMTEPTYHIVFIATGAEEIGHQGVHYYLNNPLFDRQQIIANLNIDGFNVTGKRLDFFVMPKRPSALLTNIKHVAEKLGWQYLSPGWENSMDDKFDTAQFLAHNIPAGTIWTGTKLLNGHEAPGLPFGAIHSVDDEVNMHWDWSGIADHLTLYEMVIKRILTSDTNTQTK
ncbi:M28 family peptidase [Thalassotalea maritima]|uniref:M28 family peptidase n=1 Tax=Thalassotalea maritima TaxID=3242416 RepID=UPI003528F65D